MRKYYISKIFLDESDPTMPQWRHRLQTYPNVDYAGGEIKTDPQTGMPTEKALLVLVGSKDHAKFRGDPDLIEVPAGRDSLNTQIGATDTPTKLKFRRDVKALGFDDAEIETLSDNVNSWKQLINAIGKKNNPSFDVDNFDLDEG